MRKGSLTYAKYESTEKLIQLAQAGDKEAMEILVMENDALIRFVVRKFTGRGKEYEDLYQLGRIGLVRAVQNFDAHFDVRFSTYAVPVIMGEIRRFLRDDHPIHISRTIRENAKKTMDFLNDYGQDSMALDLTDASYSQNLVLGLKQVGFNEEEIAKICYKNVEDFLLKYL